MYIGMLWRDDSTQPVAAKIASAASYYAEKYGETPNMVMLPLDSETPDIPGFTLEQSQYIQHHHFLIGVEEAI